MIYPLRGRVNPIIEQLDDAIESRFEPVGFYATGALIRRLGGDPSPFLDTDLLFVPADPEQPIRRMEP